LAQPGEIVMLEDQPFGRALRRHQTGRQPTDADLLDFPADAATRLTVAFDARVSTADSRTLDLFLLCPGQRGQFADIANLRITAEPILLDPPTPPTGSSQNP
jgi:hypothetical protein